MSLLTHNSTPAERARGCTFAEKFESRQAVAQNGGAVASTPAIDFGITYDGINDDVTYPAGGLFGQAEVSIVVEFTPGFDYDYDSAVYFFRAGPTVGDLYQIVKAPNIGSNQIDIQLGGTAITTIAEGTYSPYWVANGRNVLVVSGTSGNTNAWLNGSQILTADATVWTPKNPDTVYANFSSYFSGIQHSLYVFNQALTAQEALDFYNNTTYTYENETSLHLPMGADQHDPTNVRTLDVSGNARHATFGDGSTPTTYPTKIARHHGYDFDGGDYLLGNAVGLYNSAAISYALEFSPSFDYTLDQSLYLLDASAVGRHYIIKYNAVSGYVLSFKLGDGIGSNVPSATYGPYWRVGRQNILIVSADGATLQIVLNGVIIRSVAYLFTPTDPPVYSIGSSYGGTGNFSGDFHSFRVWRKALTPLQIHDLTIRTLGKVNDV